ncbi:MAG: DUF4003 family protein [Clostridium sp.]|nr:DUF4003 family protein [Clostridium sp.]
MKDKLINVCDRTIDNYRLAKEELRFDGDYINHFAALTYGSINENIPIKKVKEIRSAIKKETSRISVFRGDILYILSFLLAFENNVEEVIKKLYITYNDLREFGFRDSQYLVLASYSLVKHVKDENRLKYMIRMREVYDVIRKNYNNVTNHEDYLECALLAMSGVSDEEILEFIKKQYLRYDKKGILTNNSIQALSMTLLLNKNDLADENVYNLLEGFEKTELRVCHQFLPLLGACEIEENTEVYIRKLNEVIKYLCDEEGEYEFYMDKSFRVFIGIMLIECCKQNKKERFLKELLSKGVYSLLVSKNQGVFSEGLA